MSWSPQDCVGRDWRNIIIPYVTNSSALVDMCDEVKINKG